MGELFAKSGDGAAQAGGGNAAFDQLFNGTETDQVAEVVGPIGFTGRRDKLQALPLVELPRGKIQNTQDVFT